MSIFFKRLYQTKTVTCLIICQLLTLSFVMCQNNLNSITAAFKQYSQNSIKEKIFVHTDKSVYIAGEIIWFKLYAVNAANNKPLQLSKVGYVEILDTANHHFLQAKIALNNAEGNGSFYLPPTLNSGVYRLRAYTNWMKNFGAEYFFEKDFTIINIQKGIDTSVRKTDSKLDIQFFPEGGNLVNNLPSEIAFKASDEHGRSVPFTGVLLDNTDTILRFAPEHAGMGVFSFKPLNNHSYKTIIQTASGEKVVKDLPPAYTRGYVMHLVDTIDKIKITLQSDIPHEEDVYLFAHTQEIISVATKSYIQNGTAVFVFDKSLLGDGISQITIFNSRKQPVCERLFFKKPSGKLELKLNSDRPAYSTRNKVSLNIKPVYTEIKNDSASLSMTVYRIDSLESPVSSSINTYLLLTSDLKGYIEDPEYYFLQDDAKTNTALDLLMLTNGWRKFKWDNILSNPKPLFSYVPEYNGHIIGATVINQQTGRPANKTETYLSVPGFQNEFNSSFSNEDGHVAFEAKDFYGASEIILQTNTQRDSTYRIEITDPFDSSFSGKAFPVFNVPTETINSLLEGSISMQVQNLYSGKKLKHFIVPGIDTTAFYINPDARYLLDNYTRFTTLEEVLREYVTMVDVKKRDGNFMLSVFNPLYKVYRSDPLVLLDGVPVFDFNKLMLLDPLQLNKLEVLNRNYFLGGSVFHGILNWSSYKGDMAGYDPGIHAAIIDYDGLQLQREFYAPVYNTESQQASHLPDFRNVLLWSPNIKIATGKSGEVSFYTSDLPGRYVVEIQGITKGGFCGNKVIIFNVNK